MRSDGGCECAALTLTLVGAPLFTVLELEPSYREMVACYLPRWQSTTGATTRHSVPLVTRQEAARAWQSALANQAPPVNIMPSALVSTLSAGRDSNVDSASVKLPMSVSHGQSWACTSLSDIADTQPATSVTSVHLAQWSLHPFEVAYPPGGPAHVPDHMELIDTQMELQEPDRRAAQYCNQQRAPRTAATTARNSRVH